MKDTYRASLQRVQQKEKSKSSNQIRFYDNIESILKFLDILIYTYKSNFDPNSKQSKHESIRITSTLFRECIQT
jgi:hypothetical protein